MPSSDARRNNFPGIAVIGLLLWSTTRTGIRANGEGAPNLGARALSEAISLYLARKSNNKPDAQLPRASFERRPTGAMLELSTLPLLWASFKRRRGGSPHRQQAYSTV